MAELIAIVRDSSDKRVPEEARSVLLTLAEQIEGLQVQIDGLELRIKAWHKSNPASQRLASVPGVGPIIASTIAATVADPGVFSSGREFSA